jgi:hypothetical protein
MTSLKGHDFYVEMQADMEDVEYANGLICSDEATFHFNGEVNHHNVLI